MVVIQRKMIKTTVGAASLFIAGGLAKQERDKLSASRMERSFIMIKPDGVQRGKVGEIINRLEQRGFKLVGLRMQMPGPDHFRTHYAEHRERPFYPGLVSYMASGPVVAMCWQGEDVVTTTRHMLGQTDPRDSRAATIRGDLGVQVGRTVCHGSDSLEAAEREISLWFGEEELCDWKQVRTEL